MILLIFNLKLTHAIVFHFPFVFTSNVVEIDFHFFHFDLEITVCLENGCELISKFTNWFRHFFQPKKKLCNFLFKGKKSACRKAASEGQILQIFFAIAPETKANFTRATVSQFDVSRKNVMRLLSSKMFLFRLPPFLRKFAGCRVSHFFRLHFFRNNWGEKTITILAHVPIKCAIFSPRFSPSRPDFRTLHLAFQDWTKPDEKMNKILDFTWEKQ